MQAEARLSSYCFVRSKRTRPAGSAARAPRADRLGAPGRARSGKRETTSIICHRSGFATGDPTRVHVCDRGAGGGSQRCGRAQPGAPRSGRARRGRQGPRAARPPQAVARSASGRPQARCPRNSRSGSGREGEPHHNPPTPPTRQPTRTPPTRAPTAPTTTPPPTHRHPTTGIPPAPTQDNTTRTAPTDLHHTRQKKHKRRKRWERRERRVKIYLNPESRACVPPAAFVC